jgi:dipeptidyl aminopeptidase/acylaminoacyl peptidase
MIDSRITSALDFGDRFHAAIRGGIVDPVFHEDGNRFHFVEDAAAWDVDPETGARTPYVEAQPTAWEAELRRRAQPRNVRSGFLAGDPGPSEVPSPDGRLLLGELGHDLAVREVVDDRQHPLTADGVEDDAWDVLGAVWSDDSLRVAATRKDTRGCHKIPVVSWLQTEEQVVSRPFTRIGCARPVTTGAVIDVRTREVVVAQLPGEHDQTVQPAGFRHDGREAYFLTTDRRQRYLRLYAVDVRTGASRLVCEETQETFIIGIHQADRFAPELILDGDDGVLWYSERDGWRHLYLYGTDGRELGRVTSGPFEVVKVLGVDGETVYLTARPDLDRPYDVHLCRVQLDGSGFRQLTTEPGIHDPVLSPGKRVIVDRHSSLVRPYASDLLTVDGDVVARLAEADVSGLADLDFVPPEELTVTAVDGETVLHGVLYKPPGFDPSRVYPVIEHQYGGPQSITHPTSFAAPAGDYGVTLGLQLAQLGFVVYTVDGRGTPGRGKAFQDVVYGRFHEYHVHEHAHVLRQLLDRHPFMDRTRIGVTGGSWGGYATVRSLLLEPELYHAGVARCPVYDLDDHMASALEPYMGLPVDRPDAFRAGSSLAIVDRLQGKLLIVHGTSDVNATFSATMKMCAAAASAGKHVGLVVIPGADHGFHAGEVSFERYMREALMLHFVDALRPESSSVS